MIYIGKHLSIKDGIAKTIQKSIDNDLYTTQIFIGNPQGTALSKITEKEKTNIISIIKDNNFRLIIHSKYILNFSKEFGINEWHLKTFIEELELSNSINAECLVIHMGKSVKLGLDEAKSNFINSIKYFCKYIKENNLNVKIGLETAASQGTELFGNKKDFCDMFNLFTIEEKKCLNCIVDTAHIFSSGENLNNNIDEYLKYISKNIGKKYIGAFHLNGSKVECGAKKDRHSDLKTGFINYDVLLKVAEFGVTNNIPIILETPSDSLNEAKDLVKYFSSK